MTKSERFSAVLKRNGSCSAFFLQCGSAPLRARLRVSRKHRHLSVFQSSLAFFFTSCVKNNSKLWHIVKSGSTSKLMDKVNIGREFTFFKIFSALDSLAGAKTSAVAGNEAILFSCFSAKMGSRLYLGLDLN